MILAGIDIGSRTVKALVWDAQSGRALGSAVADTGHAPQDHAKDALAEALRAAGIEREALERVTATGYGRQYFPSADRAVTEITCHAVGCIHLFPEARLVVDIGGQDSKVIALDAGGIVRDFALNDRCAAGTGTFIEMVATSLDVPLGEMGAIAARAETAVEIASTCAVFAQSEIVGLVQSGTPRSAILRGVFRAIARRTRALVQQVGLTAPVALSGGVALNAGVRTALEDELATPLLVPERPQLTGALGAALLAARR